MDSKKIIRQIQDAFNRYDGDGTFVKDDRAIPFKLIRPPAAADSPIVIARKTQLVLGALGFKLNADSPGFLGRGALPVSEDGDWICAFVRDHRLHFLGDLGPADLMYFAWLREHVRSDCLHYLGINDDYLKKVGITNPQLITYPMTELQKEAMTTLETVFSDWRDTVGPKCAEIVLAGYVMDLDGLVGHFQSDTILVQQSYFQSI